MHWFAPKDQEFFGILAEQSESAYEAIRELKNFIDSYSDIDRSERKSRAQSVKNIENRADDIKNKIIERLDMSTRIPLDKDDIRKLALLLEEIVDLINSVVARFVILGIERIDSHIPKLVNLDMNIVEEINRIILHLRELKSIEENYSKISDLENKADLAYHEAMSELFHFYKNSIDIMKYKEIYELLEQIADKCKDVANAAKSVITKHS